MQIIEGVENFNELIKSLPKNKKISRIPFLGNSLHEGHKYLSKEAKKDSDILIMNYIGHCDYICRRLLYNEPKEKILKNDNLNIKELAKHFDELEEVDYLVINKIQDRQNNITISEESIKNFNYIHEECKKLNLSKGVAVTLSGFDLENPLEFVTHHYYGIKNLYMNVLWSKFCKRQIELRKPYVKEEKCIPVFVKDEKGNVLSRTKIDYMLMKVRQNVIEEIKRGKTKSIELEKLMSDYYIENPLFSILDIKTVEKIDEINDNCLIMLMSKFGIESIVISNGKLIY